MKYILKITLILLFFTIIFSCSTRKNTVINRNYHAITTKFNVLFNGKEYFEKGIKAINETHQDNFWKQLPIEPLEFTQKKLEASKSRPAKFSGFNNSSKNRNNSPEASTPFDKAEEKAVKAIQKHAMNIVGKERNRQIDDAYLLLGKSRYYSQRFIPAIEAFNYVIENYPSANLINETKIWRAKSNIRLDNEKFAIETLKYLLIIKDTLEVDLPDLIKERGFTALAMAYVKSDSLQKAKQSLIKATKSSIDKAQASRNMFVLGQMYASENKKDSATRAFKRLLNFNKAPKKYRIFAQIEIAKNFPKDSSSGSLSKKLQKLIKDRDNKQYLDALYFQVGVLDENKDSISLAIKNYNKSLRAKSGKSQQKTYTYERLANVYFKKNEFQLASSYYDSVLKVAKNPSSLRIRRVKRKFKNLASLIKFEKEVKRSDSILSFTKMSLSAQELYFQQYVEKLKKKDEKKVQKALNQLAYSNSLGSSLQSTNKGKWYFYNGQSLSFGKTEFEKNWGNRALKDDWRWSARAVINTAVSTISLQQKPTPDRYDVKIYIAKIPSSKIIIDSLKTDRNEGLFELGLIYKQQFINLSLAAEKLERLLTLEPEKKKLLAIYYNLYQIYNNAKNKLKEDFFKNKILKEYPNTKFAQIIQFPNKELKEEGSLDEVEETYKEIYYLYKENKFEEVELKINELLSRIINSILIPKFELLKAYAIGKYKEKEAYKEALEFVAISYGETEQGKKARQILQQLSK